MFGGVQNVAIELTLGVYILRIYLAQTLLKLLKKCQNASKSNYIHAIDIDFHSRLKKIILSTPNI